MKKAWTAALEPADYVLRMPLDLTAALLSATRRGDEWTVTSEQAHRLRLYGLVEIRGRCLTVFGMSVRRALVDKPVDIAA